jgi:2-polyprenyl-3-methyl-5-hydroxy-6-metoxy-1,4-benzoquinol methylase
MNRLDWLKEKRRRAEERMDTLFAPTYDENWGNYSNESHRTMLGHFLALCPPGCPILDAACGTGKYWPSILASGRSVYGADQSQQMLNQAHAKFPDVPVEKLGLQELNFVAQFDGIICMDAMEFVFPEDWPLVLANFHSALRPGGHLYFTVELIDEDELRLSQEAALALGRPVVAGEMAHEDGYHYYPQIERVRAWVGSAHFVILEEAVGDDYHHVLVRKAPLDAD